MTATTRTKKKVVLRGSVSEIDKGATSFQLQPIHGDKVRVSASKGTFDELDRVLKEGGDHARLLVKGVGVYRHNELEYLMQVDAISLIGPLDIVAQLDDLRNLKVGWYDGYGKAPSHEGLDWLAKKFVSEYPDDLPLPYAYPTPEGGVQMEWSIGVYDISLEVDFAEQTGDWHNLNLHKVEEADTRTLRLADSGDWDWLSAEIRRLTESVE